MEIRKTKPEELNILIRMYENARIFMASHGNPLTMGEHLSCTTDPDGRYSSGNSYVCVEHDKIIATFYYKEGIDDTYVRIYEGQWLNEAPYGVVHRITSDGTIRGAASFCLNWAFNKCGNLKIDTHRDNIVMQHLLDKNGLNIVELSILKTEVKELPTRKYKMPGAKGLSPHELAHRWVKDLRTLASV